jgi:hypothetical protein
MKKTVIVVFTALMVNNGFAQTKQLSPTDQFVDLAATIGSSRGAVAASYVHNWRLGQKKKWEIGIGGRLTSSFGTKQEYITAAPASLTRTNTIPFLIVFAGQKTENWDTLTVQRPWINSLNFTVNIGYNFSGKWSGGFNIDVIGFSVGRKSAAILTSNGITRTEAAAKPAAFNLLLTGDHDYGSLNSEFFLKYKLNDRWALRGVYQFLFNEYKTSSIKQTAPDGTEIDRFRIKANNLGVAVSYHL